MHSANAILKTPPPYSCFITSSKFTNPDSRCIQLKSNKQINRKCFFESLKCSQSSDSNFNSSQFYSLESNSRNPDSTTTGKSNVAGKIQSLVSEFKSLSESIDRVKRLLHYATLLPPFDESGRVEANRVMGCTTQVWLEAGMDANQAMRFKADSDSEITKGFCSCLIWLLDGAAPEEVLKVKTEDLVDMNVGLFGRAHSRVNTWHNILISMQKRTRSLVAERESKQPQEPEPFPSLVISTDGITAKMNPLSSLLEVCHCLPDDTNILSTFEAGGFDTQIPLEKTSC